MIRFTPIVLAGFLVCEPVAAADHLTGQELWNRCSGQPGSVDNVSCISWIEGLVAGLALGETAGKQWCFPNGGTVGQARLIIEKVMRDHPELLHEDALPIAAAALRAAFPCENSN
jgi:hypothetical protein